MTGLALAAAVAVVVADDVIEGDDCEDREAAEAEAKLVGLEDVVFTETAMKPIGRLVE